MTASSACAALPDAVRSRTYEARVTLQSGQEFAPNSQFEVSVSTPPFLEQHRSFQLGVAGDYVGGFAGDLHGFPGLAERITPTSYLAIGGSIAGSTAPIGQRRDRVVERGHRLLRGELGDGADLQLRDRARGGAQAVPVHSSTDSEAPMTPKPFATLVMVLYSPVAATRTCLPGPRRPSRLTRRPPIHR